MLERRERKHWNQMQWTSATSFAIRHTMTNSSSKQQQLNSNIGTYYRTAATEVHGRHIQIHTRTSCSSVWYNNFLSGQGTLLLNRTRCLQNKKRNNSKNNTQSSSGGSSTMYPHKTDFSIAQATPQSSSYIFLHRHKKREMSNNIIPDSNHGQRGQRDSNLPVRLLRFLHDNLSD